MTEDSDGGIDPALADAVQSITATHEGEWPRGDEPDAATDAEAVSAVPGDASDTAASGVRETDPAGATGATTGGDHG